MFPNMATQFEPYRLHRHESVPNWDIQIPSVLTTRATRKTTRFSVRDAKYNAAGAMHRVAWALQNSKAIGQKCEKPWENQGFAAKRTGLEQPTNSLGKTHFLITRDAKYEVRRFQCLRRLGTLSIATNLQLLCSPIYRVTVFRLQSHLQGHRSGVSIANHSAFQFVTTLRRGG